MNKDLIPVFMVGTPDTFYLPLALGMIQAYAMTYDDGKLKEKCRFMPVVYGSPKKAALIGRAFGPGIWLMSDYVWNMDHTLAVSKAIKNVDERNIIVHGGPNVPKYEQACLDFLDTHSYVDIAVRGEGEITAAALLDHISDCWEEPNGWKKGISNINGVTTMIDGELVRGPDRPRAKDINTFPSPYLEGVFNAMAADKIPGAVMLETNRGCPYGCTFCDWGSSTNQKIRFFELDRVRAEINWIATHKISILWLADANFGILERDVEIASLIAAAKKQYGFPREIVINYAKNTTRHIVQITKTLTDAGISCQGTISVQTTDEETLRVIDRSNIKTQQYNDMVDVFAQEGLPLSTDLMIGLPGATVESFKKDLQLYFDRDIVVKAWRTRVLVNSPMADPSYMAQHKIETDEKGLITSTYSFTEPEVLEMERLFGLYMACVNYSLLRYVLRFLQWDYGIGAIECLHRLLRYIETPASDRTTQLTGLLGTRDALPLLGSLSENVAEFYEQIAAFCNVEYGIEIGSTFNTVLHVNRAVLPHPAEQYPLHLALEHDFVAYFEDHANNKIAEHRPLAEYPMGQLIITDPDGFAQEHFAARRKYSIQQFFWELESPLRQVLNKPHFIDTRHLASSG